MISNRKYTEIEQSIYMLHEPMFPVYLIRGEKNFLIDSAISALTNSILGKLDELLKGETLHSVLLTHSHYDHTGVLPALQKKYRCGILGSPQTVELLKKPRVREFIADMNTRFNRVLGSGEVAEFPELHRFTTVKEGDQIPVDSRRYFEVIETPGHTRCSASFLLMPDRILFPGDAAGVLEKNNKVKPLFLSGYSAYLSSIRKLVRLKAEILCPPHNTCIRGSNRVQEHLLRSLEVSEILKMKIEKALKSGMTIKETTRNIMETEFHLPVVEGPKKAFDINLTSMVRTVCRETGIRSCEE